MIISIVTTTISTLLLLLLAATTVTNSSNHRSMITNHGKTQKELQGLGIHPHRQTLQKTNKVRGQFPHLPALVIRPVPHEQGRVVVVRVVVPPPRVFPIVSSAQCGVLGDLIEVQRKFDEVVDAIVGEEEVEGGGAGYVLD